MSASIDSYPDSVYWGEECKIDDKGRLALTPDEKVIFSDFSKLERGFFVVPKDYELSSNEFSLPENHKIIEVNGEIVVYEILPDGQEVPFPRIDDGRPYYEILPDGQEVPFPRIDDGRPYSEKVTQFFQKIFPADNPVYLHTNENCYWFFSVCSIALIVYLPFQPAGLINKIATVAISVLCSDVAVIAKEQHQRLQNYIRTNRKVRVDPQVFLNPTFFIQKIAQWLDQNWKKPVERPSSSVDQSLYADELD